MSASTVLSADKAVFYHSWFSANSDEFIAHS